MAISTMCDFPYYQHTLPHWKNVLHFCSRFPIIFTPNQLLVGNTPTKLPTIYFHVYKFVTHCTVSRKMQLSRIIKISVVFHSANCRIKQKIYSRKGLVITKTYNSDFHKKFYITEIQKIAFNLPHLHILDTQNCGK